jgi:hypothetical protein
MSRADAAGAAIGCALFVFGVAVFGLGVVVATVVAAVAGGK